jgi:hypothetical protein
MKPVDDGFFSNQNLLPEYFIKKLPVFSGRKFFKKRIHSLEYHEAILPSQGT